MRVGWVGLGKCGLPIAEAVGQKCDVIAYDIVPQNLTYAHQARLIQEIVETDLCFVLVQTPNKEKFGGAKPIDLYDELEDFDYTALRSVLESLDGMAYNNPVIISSTVSPGTTSLLCAEYPSLDIVYMPIMIHIGKVAETYLSSPLYFIGTKDSLPIEILYKFLQKVTKTTKIMTGTYEEVELYKLMGNLYCSLKIAFSNNVSDLIEQLNLNASSFTVLEALMKDTVRFNSTMFLSPGSGDGGPCHPRDGVVLSHISKQTTSQFANNIAQAREDQACNLANYLCDFELPVVILGKSFKPGVDLTDGSYSVLVGEYIKELNPELDVMFDSDFESSSCVVLVTHKKPDILTNFKFHPESIIVDLWDQSLRNVNNFTVKVYGNRRTRLP